MTVPTPQSSTPMSDELENELDSIVDDFFVPGTERKLSELKAALRAYVAKEYEEGFIAGQNDIIQHAHHDPAIQEELRKAALAADAGVEEERS